MTELIKKLLMVTETQFTEVINVYRDKLKNEEFRQNFDVFRAYSYIFAMFGLAETPEPDTAEEKSREKEKRKADKVSRKSEKKSEKSERKSEKKARKAERKAAKKAGKGS